MSKENVYNYHSSYEKMQKAIEMVEKILPVKCKYDKEYGSTTTQTFAFWTEPEAELNNSQVHFAHYIIQNIINFCKC